MRFVRLSLVATCAVGALATTSVHAQSAAAAPGSVERSASAADSLGDIVVTARRRDERLQDVPVAVSAVTGAQLQARSVRTIEDISRIAPNTQITPNARGAQTATINIRGLENTLGAITNDPAVGVYFDEVYLGRTAGNILASVEDMASIQVLRGPQGTLFGRNNTGGALVLTPKRPDVEDFGGEAFATVGSFNRFDYGGVVNVPIVKGKLAVRGSWRWNRQDGIGRSIVTGVDSWGNRHNDGGRIALRWQATDDAVFDFTYDRTNVRETGPLVINVVPANRAPNQGFYENRAGLTAPVSNAMVEGQTLRGEIRLAPDMNLKVIAGHRRLWTYLQNDADGTPITSVDTAQFAGQHQWSGEVQLSGTTLRNPGAGLSAVNYTLGAFYFKEDGYDGSSVSFPLPNPADLRSAALAFRNITATNESSAVYGQIETSHFDKLFLTAGIRFTRDKRDAQLQGLRAGGCILGALGPNFATVPANQCFIVGSRSYSYISYSLGARYQLSDDINLYLKYDKADRAGGLQGIPTEFISYDVESVKSVEAGLKALWLDRKVKTNLSVFQMKIPAMQRATVITLTPSGATIPPAAVVSNVGDGRVRGFELEVSVNPIPGLTLEGSLGYLDAKYTKLTDPAFIARQAVLTTPLRFPDTPRWTSSAAINYVAQLGNIGELLLRADYSHKSRQYMDATNVTVLRQDKFDLVNARVQLTVGNLPFGKEVVLAAFARNLTKAKYYAYGSNVNGGIMIPGDPRTFGGEVRIRF